MKLPQGNKSTVTVEVVGEHAVVRKTYNDNGDPVAKTRREVAFYRWYEGVPGIPRLHADESPAQIRIELLEGAPLSVWVQGKSKASIDMISLAHGKHVATMLQHAPPEELRTQIAAAFDKEATCRSMIDATLSVVEAAVSQTPEFGSPEIHEAIALARQTADANGFWGTETLCKLDWNAGNMIVANDSIRGYVDFEQSFMGNRLLFLGTVIDHINVLSWPAVAAGIRESGLRLPPPNLQYAAACFSMCYKLRGCCRDGRITFFTPSRLANKFREMKTIIEAAA